MAREDGHFKPGNKGGPGRPKGTVMSDALKRIAGATEALLTVKRIDEVGKVELETWRLETDGKEVLAHAMAMALVKKALAGDVRAFREVADRTDGKARQFVEIDTGPTNPLEELSDDELAIELSRLRKANEAEE